MCSQNCEQSNAKNQLHNPARLEWLACRDVRAAACLRTNLALVVSGGDVHLLLHHVVDVGGGAALDPLLLLPLQLVSHHLDGLCPLIPEFADKTHHSSVTIDSACNVK